MPRSPYINARNPAHIIALALSALLLGLFLALPLGHQLFHDGAFEPETCPVHILESSLVLLSISALTLLFLWTCASTIALFDDSAPLPPGYRGYSRSNRAPPRS